MILIVWKIQVILKKKTQAQLIFRDFDCPISNFKVSAPKPDMSPSLYTLHFD